jgi:hypothetical protein
LSFDAVENAVVFDRPRLPPFLSEVRLLNLRLGQSSISVMLRRMGNEVAMNVLERSGAIHAILKS